MARIVRIRDLDGRMMTCSKPDDKTWREVVERARLPRRYGRCIRHWLSGDDITEEMERSVKSYLDRVGYLLILDDPDDGILTDYKEMRDRVAMIPISSCAVVEDFAYGAKNTEDAVSIVDFQDEDTMSQEERGVVDSLRKPKRIPPSIQYLQGKRKRMDEFLEEKPGAAVTYRPVDTENVFTFENRRWRIDPSVKQYQGVEQKDEVFYAMDQVVCVRWQGMLFFCDQDWVEISQYVAEM